jgi:hypothetical protein
MIFAYDHREFIMANRVLCGRSVTVAFYLNWLLKLRRKLHKNRPDLLGDGPLILHDNARPNFGKVLTDLLRNCEWELLPFAPYSPPDSVLFHTVLPTWKRFLQRLPEPS